MVQPIAVKPMPVRARFYKMGMLQYISHLDLVRTVTRNLVRAGIPVWYSEGFNPRVKLTFAMPLSIGTQSEREFFDIRLVEPMGFDEIRDRLNAALTDEMKVVEVYESPLKFSEIGWSDYEWRLTSPVLNADTAEAMRELYTHPLTLVKHSKGGDKETDIAPFIRLKSCDYTDGGITVRALLTADSANYLNPEYLVRAAEDKLGIRFEDPFTEYYSIIRKEVYLADGVTVFR